MQILTHLPSECVSCLLAWGVFGGNTHGFCETASITMIFWEDQSRGYGRGSPLLFGAGSEERATL